MKLLITGGTGQVGFELRRQLVTLGEILAPTRPELDLADAQAVERWLARHQPDLVVNAAAYTAVDGAETDTALATRLNAQLPAQLADYCRARDAWLVHYSSDYVYSGSGSAPWRETAKPSPVNAYGRTKLAGDRAIEQSGCRHLIFRTSWVYSARGRNFMKTMLRLGAERSVLKVVADQRGAPTPARLIALVTQQMLARRHSLGSGLYHLAPRGETSWHGFAQEIFALAEQAGLPLAITPAAVAPIATADYPTPAPRPLNSRLELDKLEQALATRLPSWQRQAALTLEEIAPRSA
ncbi:MULTISPECIES: dTDP-4-dehydrorhamnose reductase [Halomonas]|uniref:dTDP-4-dehydrorhamnose reductase n=1 Tax=Halomonas ventosae TaxID=229007 RepID=A0A4R6HQJ5_9GAMM|nr:dTDP-4-dehydrorhamnose reductase [Halomonas ventosae]TDO10648.1 dTDP-4-dehydrorhamnose reductase [Halomonas ventosae]